MAANTLLSCIANLNSSKADGSSLSPDQITTQLNITVVVVIEKPRYVVASISVDPVIEMNYYNLLGSSVRFMTITDCCSYDFSACSMRLPLLNECSYLATPIQIRISIDFPCCLHSIATVAALKKLLVGTAALTSSSGFAALFATGGSMSLVEPGCLKQRASYPMAAAMGWLGYRCELIF